MTHRVQWGQNLQAARVARNLTQEKLARLLDVGLMQISRWERGVTAPRDAMKVRLADFYGIPAADLFPLDAIPLDKPNGGAAA